MKKKFPNSEKGSQVKSINHSLTFQNYHFLPDTYKQLLKQLIKIWSVANLLLPTFLQFSHVLYPRYTEIITSKFNKLKTWTFV